MKPKLIFIDNDKESDRINFGISCVGVITQKNIIVKNIGNADIDNLKFTTEHPDIKIISAPSVIEINKQKSMTLEYKPVQEIEQGLTAIEAKINWEGNYLV